MDVERERLEALYKGYTDAQLLEVSRDEANLTDAAQTALTEELTARGLEYGPASEELESGFGPGIPGMFPSGAAVMEKALEPGGEAAAGRVELVSFFDGHELTRACEALDGAGVDVTLRQREGNAMTGSPSWYEIWVAEAELDRAKNALREKIGLFPLAEMEGSDDSSADDDGTTMPIALLETREEAETAAGRLVNMGYAARVVPDEAENGFAVEVPVAERERALEALAQGLSV